MILILVTLIAISLSRSDQRSHFQAPKPTPSGECLETLEYCMVNLI